MHLVALLVSALLFPLVSFAREPRVVRLRFPPVRIEGGTNPELCVAARIAVSAPLDVASIEIRHRGLRRPVAVQHFLVYAYTGTMLDAFPDARAAPIPSRGCLDFGPADRDARQLVASGTARRSRSVPLPGGALRLAPATGAPAALGFVLDGEWTNPGSKARRVSTTVLLHRAGKRDTAGIALLFADRSAEDGLLVAPGELASTETQPAGRAAAWTRADVCVLAITGQMHKRGSFFGVDLVAPDGSVVNPAGGVENPFEPGRRHFFGAFDWTDMGTLLQPIRLTAGQALHYACWDDNGAARPGRLGCEEAAGVVPGAIGAPAKPCAADTDCPAADPAYPGRSFTGVCRPANLVAGVAADDEVCRLDGIYVDGDAGGRCGTP